MPGTFPAEIVNHGGDVAPSGSATSDTTNGWHVSNHRRLTAVVAGRASDKSDGDFDIYRESYICTQQKADSVTVPGAGAVRITDAPEGRGPVQTWSQKRGEIDFTSTSGVTGTLHLADDTVTLDP